MVRPGNYVETRVQLPEGWGAWPGLFTWLGSNNEIDTFEYHPDRPTILELTNHVNPSRKEYDSASEIGPGKWVTIGTYYGALSVSW